MITSFVGENSFVLRQKLKKRIDAFVAEYGDFGLQKLDGEEVSYDRIQEAVQSLPFLATKNFVVLECPGTIKQFAETAETLLADIPDSTDVLIVEPAVDKRTSYYKWLKKATDFHEFKTLPENELAAWVVSFAKTQHSAIAANDARYLIQRTGATQEGLANEIAKLALDTEKITKAVIDEMTDATPHSKIFDLLDAAFSGNKQRALLMYDEQRALKVQPQEIIAMIGWQLRIVALAKTAGQHDLVREAKMSPYAADKAMRIARGLQYSQLKQQVHDLVQIDALSKRSPIDLDEALQNYIINL